MADLRRKHVGSEIVSHETISLKAPVRHGLGLDWTAAEIEVLKRTDIDIGGMQALLPNRSERAIYLKRHRLGLCRRYQKMARA